ncbi:hypothetical protein AOQ84DRAFT_178871 [Glonium stellatum]|uniref:Uncharacterized protein n=1 Tax=Glonium stellatum TaxID=574774 RepID=A0A8E2F721_9PEZI|nr:hypothetical protein AOQ84DRAFT_178871 [Glonium stellatum]
MIISGIELMCCSCDQAMPGKAYGLCYLAEIKINENFVASTCGEQSRCWRPFGHT